LLGGADLRWYFAAAEIVFAFAWWWLLQSYRMLNSAKFKVINAIEPRLPVRLFCEGCKHLENPRCLWPLGGLWAWLKGIASSAQRSGSCRSRSVAIYVAELIRQATN
jgi:hypothetical protein